MIRLAGCLLAVSLATGCATLKSPFATPVKVDEEATSEQRRFIESAQSALQAQNWATAEEQFSAFLRRYPVSVYTAQAYYGRGRALEGLGQPAAAIQVYRELGEQARTVAPEMAARAYVRMSYAYEVLGDETRGLAALADAEGLGEALPEETRRLEIPTRRAAALMRLGRKDEARRLLAKVEKELPDVSAASPENRRREHAEILLGLGTLNVGGVTPENFLPTVEAVQALQPFLWRVVRLKVSPASAAASDQLKDAYFGLAQLAFSPPKIVDGRDRDVRERAQAELQKKWVARLLESVSALKILAADDLTEGGETLVSTISQIEENGRQILWGRQTLTPLTEESKFHQGTRKEGRVISEPVFDTEKSPPAVDRADPNLNEVRP